MFKLPTLKQAMLKPIAPNYWPTFPALGFTTLFALLLSACAPLQKQPDPAIQLTPPSWPAHQSAMQAIDSWQLQGKLAYRNDKTSGSAWFDWTQHGDNFTIYLSGPFGVGTVQISGNAQAITLSQPGEADISSHSSSALTQRLFGWQLPVEPMRAWVRGIPAGSTAGSIKTFNQKGLLDTLLEDGWQLNISRYQGGPRGPLPGKIKGHSDKLSFTLLLKDWRFADDSPDSNTTPRHSPDR
ncbi:MAG: outer membrane lipoprotein LolB [Gammaproteobacteria bacterium]|nr:outer membrane lipoprotein LolB [Gammaproteobacteria bacterium]MBQ0839556.1 outer membrane lipoprotein LolB [Gammaproteobacteria bacterium]